METPGTADRTCKNDTKNGADTTNSHLTTTSHHTPAAGSRAATPSANTGYGNDTTHNRDDTATVGANTDAPDGNHTRATRTTGLAPTPDAGEASARKGSTPEAGAMAKFRGGPSSLSRDSADNTHDMTEPTATRTADTDNNLLMLILAVEDDPPAHATDTGLQHHDADEASERKGSAQSAGAMAKIGDDQRTPGRAGTTPPTSMSGPTTLHPTPVTTIPDALQTLIQEAVQSWEIRLGTPSARS